MKMEGMQEKKNTEENVRGERIEIKQIYKKKLKNKKQKSKKMTEAGKMYLACI